MRGEGGEGVHYGGLGKAEAWKNDERDSRKCQGRRRLEEKGQQTRVGANRPVGIYKEGVARCEGQKQN